MTFTLKSILLSILLLQISCSTDNNSHNQKVTTKDTFVSNAPIKVEEFYHKVNGLKDGLYYLLNSNGDTLLKGNYKLGKRDGLWIKYVGDTVVFVDPQGQKFIGNSSDNRIEYLYYRNDTNYKKIENIWYSGHAGQLSSQTVISYDSDTTELSTSWFENGKLQSIGTTRNGILNDTLREWRNDGTLKSMEIYRDGFLMKGYEYDLTGKKELIEKFYDKKKQKMIEQKIN